MQKHSMRWLAAFSVFSLAMHEAHELAQTFTGRVMCGEWAVRDFNEWNLSDACTTPVPTAAGPLFSYLLIAVGIMLTRGGSERRRWTGLALIFSSNPLARVITVLMRGGDELTVVRMLGGGPTITPAEYWATAALVTAVCGVGIVFGWVATRGLRHRAARFAAMLLLPMVLTGTLLFVVGNGLLGRGVLVDPVIAGTPALVLAATALVGVLTVATARWLGSADPAR